jgi:hypothetical protein
MRICWMHALYRLFQQQKVQVHGRKFKIDFYANCMRQKHVKKKSYKDISKKQKQQKHMINFCRYRPTKLLS